MANIGSFKKSGQEFQGEIVTLSVQTKGVRIVPETSRANGNGLSHRVYAGRASVGGSEALCVCDSVAFPRDHTRSAPWRQREAES